MWLAWSGGLAFAGSLIYLVYFYVVVLGSNAGRVDARTEHILFNTALFCGFALHHSLFARRRTKQLVVHLVTAPVERTIYVWIASVLTFTMCALWQPIAGMVYAIMGFARLPFWLTQALGLALVVAATRQIRVLELAGVRQGAPADIRASGPFRRVRHPIYLGWILMVFGTPTMTANRLLFAAISSAYLILAIPWEERSLVADHGDRYREYQKTVRWRLLPGVW